MNAEGPPAPPLPDGQWTLDEICADFARKQTHRPADLPAAIQKKTGVSRRAFLGRLASGAAAGTVSAAAGRFLRAAQDPSGPATAPAEETATTLPTSRVVFIRNPEVILRGYRVNPLVVRQMLDQAMMVLTGKADERAAWSEVARTDDFVAVKHNSIGRPTLHSHTEINDAVAARLSELAKCDPKRILVVDRTFPPEVAELSDPYTLPTRGLKTRLRRLYVETATAIVNVSVLKSHFTVGVSCAMKNHLGSINNPSAYHGWEPGRLPANVPELNALAPLRTKTRLCIVDAIRPLFAGGPADNDAYRWDLCGLIVGTDPVAVTSVGLDLLETKRETVRREPWPITAGRQMTTHGQTIGLGNADPARIDLVTMDVK